MASIDSGFVSHGWWVVSGDDGKPMLWMSEFHVVPNRTWSGLSKC
jgi:hypothetical protein